MDEVTHENHELRLLLEQSEAKLEREQKERQDIVDYYKKYLARSEASKKKHDSALEEYHKYQMDQMSAKIRKLEEEAASRNDASYSTEESDDEEEEDSEDRKEVLSNINGESKTKLQDVIDLDSDE